MRLVMKMATWVYLHTNKVIKMVIINKKTKPVNEKSSFGVPPCCVTARQAYSPAESAATVIMCAIVSVI